MSTSFARALRRTALLSIIVAVLLASVLVNRADAGIAVRAPRRIDTSARVSLADAHEARGRYASTPTVLRVGGKEMLAYPPSKTAAAGRPLAVVYLHGARGRAANGCPWFRSGASALGWLVCPQSSIEEEADGSFSWGADVFKQAPIVDDALRAARARGASSEPGIAVGFSQGSYVALDLVKARLAAFRGLVLLGAELHPDARVLKEAGIMRIALGAGKLDHVAHASLVLEAKRLDREGIETRFFDLGNIGHSYTVEDPAILAEAIAFAGGGA